MKLHPSDKNKHVNNNAAMGREGGQILVLFPFLYQMQDGGQDLVNGLNLVRSEADDFHGVGDGLEVGPVIDAGLQTEERWKSSVRNQR